MFLECTLQGRRLPKSWRWHWDQRRVAFSSTCEYEMANFVPCTGQNCLPMGSCQAVFLSSSPRIEGKQEVLAEKQEVHPYNKSSQRAWTGKENSTIKSFFMYSYYYRRCFLFVIIDPFSMY